MAFSVPLSSYWRLVRGNQHCRRPRFAQLLSDVGASFLGRDAVFVINSASFLLSAALLRRMNFREAHIELHGPLRLRDLVDYSPIADGIRYIRSDARLVATMFVKCGIGIMGVNWVL